MERAKQSRATEFPSDARLLGADSAACGIRRQVKQLPKSANRDVEQPKTMFNRITDHRQIRETLDAHMMEPEKQRAPFLATIFSREHCPGGIIYEGHRPISACQTGNERTYTLSTSDSNYQRGCAALKLSGIEYVETLR